MKTTPFKIIFVILISLLNVQASESNLERWLIDDVFKMQRIEMTDGKFYVEKLSSFDNLSVIQISNYQFSRWAIIEVIKGKRRVIYKENQKINDYGYPINQASFSKDGKYVAVVGGYRSLSAIYINLNTKTKVGVEPIYLTDDEDYNVQIEESLQELQWAKENRNFEIIFSQIKGIAGFGSIESKSCGLAKNCIHVYFEDKLSMKKFMSSLPKNQMINGILIKAEVIGVIDLQ